MVSNEVFYCILNLRIFFESNIGSIGWQVLFFRCNFVGISTNVFFYSFKIYCHLILAAGLNFALCCRKK